MIWFERDRIPQGHWPFLNTTRVGLAELEEIGNGRFELDLKDGEEHLTITGILQAYRFATSHRLFDLSQGTVAAWNAASLTGAAVCARSILETVAIYHSLHKRVEAATADKEWKKIGDLVDAYAFSTMSGPNKLTKKTRTAAHPPRIGEAVLSFIKEFQPGSERFWDQICNLCHPNGDPTLNLAGTLKNYKFTGKSHKHNTPKIFPAIYNCMYSCCWYIASALDFDIIVKQIRQGGQLGPDHRLIMQRDLTDRVTADVAKNLSPLTVGPIQKPPRRRPHRK